MEKASEYLQKKTKRWKANLDTDIEEFCRKENLYYWEKGNGILNDIGGILGQIYEGEKAQTMAQLISIPKSEFLEYGDFYGQRKKAEKCWRTMNNILKRHGLRMYVKPRIVHYP